MGETRKPRDKPSRLVKTKKNKKREKESNKQLPPQHHIIQANHVPVQVQEPESPSYRLALKSIFNCKSHLDSSENHSKRCKKTTSSTSTAAACSGSLCKQQKESSSSSLCKPEDHQEPQPQPCERRRASISACTSKERPITTKKPPLNAHHLVNAENINNVPSSSSSRLFSSAASCASSNSYSGSIGGSFRGMQFRRFSGCYECHSVVDPVLGGSMRVMCTCPECGEIFVRSESLEHHQAIRHAVSELGPEDTSRNIIEIIFQSSWLKKNSPICTIERILKVQNSQKTISKFEDYRDSIKIKSSKFAKKYPRCIADGNELLRFHCTTLACPLGLNGASNLCSSPNCHVCAVIKDGFKPDSSGRILTMATSGRAHDAVLKSDGKRAMLVCRVIAGRVRRIQTQEGSEEYDSLAGASGPYSNLDELYVLNARAILPCFVLIYKA